jgi:glyoxylase-like metal-dependent hydrolase (beta-lactamase superfamily II)
MPNNLYLLRDTAAGEAVVVDPSIGSDEALSRVQSWQQEGTRLTAIWNTHGHFDHIYDNALWKSTFQVPLGMNTEDNFFIERLREQALWFGLPQPEQMFPDFSLKAGEVLHVGAYEVQILEVPGHSPGSVAFWFASENFCIAGDVLFRGSVGRTDLPLCSHSQLLRSIALLHDTLPPSTQILTGHGEPTTIAEEWETNPFLESLRRSE